MNSRIHIHAILLALTFVPSLTHAAPKKGQAANQEVALTAAGKALEAKYAELQKSIHAEIEAALPKRDNTTIAAWLEAIKAEEIAAKHAATKAGVVSKLRKTEIVLKQLEVSAEQPPKTYAEAREELEQAKAIGKEDPKKDKLLATEESYLASVNKEREQLRGRIEKAKTAAKDAQAALPEAIKAAEAAKQVNEKAMAATWQAMDALGMNGILGSDQWDGKLAQYMVINTATPRGLAEFAEKSPENEKLIDQLFADKNLMVQMLVADGPTAHKYGEAMKIYTDIQKASPRAKDGLFQRLALAVSLTHCVPIAKRVPSADGVDDDASGDTASSTKGAPEIIDPVKRYLSYEKWYVDGELQPGFKDLSVWNLTFVVDGSDPDEIFAWGRQMLHNLRPDCIPSDGDTSVYVNVVDKEIAYTSSMVKNDLPELQFMQNILANGGICGRRAFFGRFTLRAFGTCNAGTLAS
jgi:hypothetical protein